MIDHGRIAVSSVHTSTCFQIRVHLFENLSMYSQPRFTPPSRGASLYLFKTFEFHGEPRSRLPTWNCVYPEWGLLVQMVMKNCVVELSKGVTVALRSTNVVLTLDENIS